MLDGKGLNCSHGCWFPLAHVSIRVREMAGKLHQSYTREYQTDATCYQSSARVCVLNGTFKVVAQSLTFRIEGSAWYMVKAR